MISSHYCFSMTGEGTLEDAIVRVIRYDLQSPARLNGLAKAREKHRNMRELLRIAREFARKYSEQFIENGFGKDQFVPFFNNSAQRRFATSARKQ